LLDDRETTLKSPKAVKDGHRDLLLVKAERAAGSADFYFDKQTNRLARVVMNLPPSDKSSIADIRIDSYLKVDGVLVPARWEIFENNRKQVEEEVTEVHFTKKLPAGVFDRP
jgi:aminoglycoside/choline kinase family phosphotransferase